MNLIEVKSLNLFIYLTFIYISQCRLTRIFHLVILSTGKPEILRNYGQNKERTFLFDQPTMVIMYQMRSASLQYILILQCQLVTAKYISKCIKVSIVPA